ncbi:MAG: sensor histidine kinase [Pseudomonadota bacterium]
MAVTVTSIEATLKLARLLIDASQQPMLLLDADLCVTGVSKSFRETFDIPFDPATRVALKVLGGGEWNIPQLDTLLENALHDGPEIGDYEIDLKRPKLETRRLRLSVQRLAHSEITDGETKDKLILLVVDDLTETRRVEDANVALMIEQDHLLKERAVLLQEMQHRVANSLQIIASVLMLKARTVKSEESRQHLRDAHDRVISIATVQQHLQEHPGDVQVGPYLTKLSDSLGASMIGDSRDVTITVRADAATISSHDAVSLGLVVTELVINALKHAFPEERNGRIVVDYALHAPGWTLSVTDDGIGRSPSVAAKAGLGTSVVEALGQQLGARVVISDAKPGARISLINKAGPGRLASTVSSVPAVMV